MSDTANIVLFRSRFTGGSDFPDRKLYPVKGGNLSVADDGTVSVSTNTSASESFIGSEGDCAYVDKGPNVPGRGFRVVNG